MSKVGELRSDRGEDDDWVNDRRTDDVGDSWYDNRLDDRETVWARSNGADAGVGGRADRGGGVGYKTETRDAVFGVRGSCLLEVDSSVC